MDVNARDCKRLAGARGSNTHGSKLVAKRHTGHLIKITRHIYGWENKYFSLYLDKDISRYQIEAATVMGW